MGATVSRNLAHPDNGVGGWVMTKLLIKKNAVLEREAARLCEIQPQHKVLEVGFGPGLGLMAASQYVKDGPGIVYGIDISERMVKHAKKHLHKYIANGKVQIHHGSVMQLPFECNSFDRIFHVNCYYFWPDADAALKELHRVIKPDGIIVATLNLASIQKRVAQNQLQCGNIDPQRHMTLLAHNGFVKIHMEQVMAEHCFQAIFATAKKDPQ